MTKDAAVNITDSKVGEDLFPHIVKIGKRWIPCFHLTLEIGKKGQDGLKKFLTFGFTRLVKWSEDADTIRAFWPMFKVCILVISVFYAVMFDIKRHIAKSICVKATDH